MSSPISRNWARMAEITRIPNYNDNKLLRAELSYRIAVQNNYAANGEMDPEFIEPETGIVSNGKRSKRVKFRPEARI